jgi:hygromycin-B 7''-O-kinase
MTTHLLPVIRDWSEWADVFTDAALWRPAIERLWLAEPVLAARSGVGRIETVRAGFPGTCAVFILNETAVIKLFPPLVAGDFERERAVYRLPAGRVPEMPRLLADGVLRDRSDWPYLITTFMPGVAWREARATMPAAARLAVARALGERMAHVHTTPIPSGGGWPLPDAWPRFVADRLAAAPDEWRTRAALPERVIAEAEALLRGVDWFDRPPRLLHADLTEDHALVTEQAGEWALSGLIDWADAEVGDPTYEWVVLYFGFCGGDAALFRAFLSGYDLALGPFQSQQNGTRRTRRTRRDAAVGRGETIRFSLRPSASSLRALRVPCVPDLLAYTLLHRFGANIIAGALPDEFRRNLSGLDELAGRLFPGLDG